MLSLRLSLLSHLLLSVLPLQLFVSGYIPSNYSQHGLKPLVDTALLLYVKFLLLLYNHLPTFFYLLLALQLLLPGTLLVELSEICTVLLLYVRFLLLLYNHMPTFFYLLLGLQLLLPDTLLAIGEIGLRYIGTALLLYLKFLQLLYN